MADPPRVIVHPGMIAAHATEHLVLTLLGSCVAVCLFEPHLRIGGMNHYLLPLWNGEGLATPRFGNVAIDRLVERLATLGCRPQRLQAKVFGGARVLGPDSAVFDIGARNIQVALTALEERGIPVVAQEVGGTTGFKLMFNTATGVVLMKRMQGLQAPPPPERRGR